MNIHPHFDQVDQVPADMPQDISFLYVPCKTFGKESWDRERLRSEGRDKKLVVLDLRQNGGGYLNNVKLLLQDIVSLFSD